MMYQIIVFLPLIASLIAGLFGRVIGDRASQLVTSGALISSAVLSVVAFMDVAMGGGATARVELMPWISSGDFNIVWSLRIDTLTAVMLVVVTGVSSLVHVYSIGYMSHDPHIPRFMSYLSLFTFAMLMLVTADNFVQMFFGWEGVGLASYLLIGFWYKKPSACAAAIKAFLVNRVGDFGFALGIFAIFAVFGTLNFDTVFANVPHFANASFMFIGHKLSVITTISILLFIGAMGKSAQIGLHTWLPDAMEGPTPVSALIHAATMVTAGVFMVARCSPIFEYSTTALHVVTIVGATTAFFAATVGLAQNDIKRVIAYSTCSQLGYMFFALGVSAYGAGVFHLFTHAFFKALLFLGSGSVIHAMSGEQDMRKMGGIFKKIPLTYALMLIGTLALTGVPPFAGYFSKDAIIAAAYAAHTPFGQYGFVMGVVAAFMTSFYSWRLVFMTFHGTSRASEEVQHHIHESPLVMIVPLLVLAAGAVGAGFVFHNYFIGEGYAEFWRHALFLKGDNVLAKLEQIPQWVEMLPTVMGVIGFALAWLFYIKSPEMPKRLAAANVVLYEFILNKWYFDELYDLLFVRPAKRLGYFLWKKGDGAVIDGLGPDGVSAAILGLSKRARALQSGYVYHYAFAMLIGVTAIATWFMTGGGK
jgi:NADH-quinone oxidoreductase subunit L